MIQFVGGALVSRLIRNVFAIAVSVCCLQACKKNAEAANSVDCDGNAKSFVADVKPVIQASCAFDLDCHGSGSTSGPGSLISYSEIFNARAIIRSAILSGEMPRDASLTIAEKNAIICWIDNGAANN